MKSEHYAARVAGFMFLFLIATVLASSVLIGGVEGDPIAETLRNISDDSFRVRLGVLFLIVGGISTLILAAALYATTRHQDRNLAILALSCRAVEAGLYAVGIISVLTLLSLGEQAAIASTAGPTSAYSLGRVVADVNGWGTNIGAAFFATGSLLYSYLFLKARSIPVALAALGVSASLILVVGVPLQTAGGQATTEGASAVIWIPMIIFEISTGLWLLVRGANAPKVETSGQQVAPWSEA
jgi:hypothetical protein